MSDCCGSLFSLLRCRRERGDRCFGVQKRKAWRNVFVLGKARSRSTGNTPMPTTQSRCGHLIVSVYEQRQMNSVSRDNLCPWGGQRTLLCSRIAVRSYVCMTYTGNATLGPATAALRKIQIVCIMGLRVYRLLVSVKDLLRIECLRECGVLMQSLYER